MTWSAVLFDLDGTLTDSGEGIRRSVAYALEKMGRPPLSEAELNSFIGPPLKDAFRDYAGMTAEEADSTADSMWNKLPADYRAMAATYDPVAEAAALGVPMLFLQGGNDYQVTSADFSLYQEALRGNPHARFLFLPEADHLMRPLAKQAVPAEYARFVPISGKAVREIIKFLSSRP